MQNDPSFDIELQQLRERSIEKLLIQDVCDIAAFEALFCHLNGLAVGLSREYAVPKQVLACLRDAASAIRWRTQYLHMPDEAGSLASRFDVLLDLMIIGETMDDAAVWPDGPDAPP